MPADPARQLAIVCLALGSQTGDRRFIEAARRLEGKPLGRRTIDDTAALEYAKALLDTKMAASPHEACCRAAVLFSGTQQIETARERLRKKFRRKYCSQ